MAQRTPRVSSGRAAANKALNLFQQLGKPDGDIIEPAPVQTNDKKRKDPPKKPRKAPKPRPVNVVKGILKMPVELLQRIAAHLVSIKDRASTRMILAFSGSCQYLYSAFDDAWWAKHYDWRNGRQLSDVTGARSKVVSRLRDQDCFGCGEFGQPKHPLFGYRVCYPCRRTDPAYLLIAKTNAKTEYKVTEKDLEPLRYIEETRYYRGPIRGGVYATSKLYSVQQIEKVVKIKADKARKPRSKKKKQKRSSTDSE